MIQSCRMVPKFKLNDTLEIPSIGFGTWKLTGEEGRQAIQTALEIGYRHIDTADRYGNHKEVAEAIKNSGVGRDELFITSKIWRDDLRQEDVSSNVDRFLNELETDYIDLLLIHWPNKDIPMTETLAALEECRQSGKIKAIGVSNFTKHHLEDALATGVQIVNNQVELHPSFNQKELREYCDSKGITVTAYSSLSSGNMELPVVKELAKKYNKSEAQIILNWVVSRGVVALAKSTKRERTIQNLQAVDFEMEPADLQKIDEVEQGERTLLPDFAEFDYK